jgi:hypothetical protein
VARPRCPPSLWRPPLGLAMISLKGPPPRVSLVVDLLFLGSSEELDDVSSEWRLPPWLGFHLLNTEERASRTDTRRGWADWPRLAGLGPFGLGFGPSCDMLHLLHFGSFARSVVGFGHRYLRDQGEGSLCMNFRVTTHPRKYPIIA